MENIVSLSRPSSFTGAPPDIPEISDTRTTAAAPQRAYATDVLPGMTGRTVPSAKTQAPEPRETPEPPRAERRTRTTRTYPRKRFGVPVLHAVYAAAGTAAGVFLAASAPAGTDFTESLLCCPGELLWLMTIRLLWGIAFLAAEYILGYFALGRALVWVVPLACGLGTGAALTGAFAVQGAAAVKLIPTCVTVLAAVVVGARASGDMSSQLLRLVTSGRNSVVAVVSESPAAGEYTLRFLVYFAVIAGAAITEAVIRSLG